MLCCSNLEIFQHSWKPFALLGCQISVYNIKAIGDQCVKFWNPGELLLSLNDFDLGMSLDNFMAGKVPSHSSVLMVCYVKGWLWNISNILLFAFGPHTLYGKCCISGNIWDYCSGSSHALWCKKGWFEPNLVILPVQLILVQSKLYIFNFFYPSINYSAILSSFFCLSSLVQGLSYFCFFSFLFSLFLFRFFFFSFWSSFFFLLLLFRFSLHLSFTFECAHIYSFLGLSHLNIWNSSKQNITIIQSEISLGFSYEAIWNPPNYS